MLAKTNKIIKRVAFFGDAEADICDEHFKLAYETAKLLAQSGFIVVNGGGPGVMLAATLGAKEVNGRVELVVLNPKKEPKNYEGINQENFKLANKKIMTSNYTNRLNTLVKIADAFVIFKGGAGTLSEVGTVWENAKFEYGSHEPLIFVGECWRDTINNLVSDLDFDKKERTVYQLVNSPEEVLELLKKRKGTVRTGMFSKIFRMFDRL